jgi:hypothetical protein
LDGAGTFDLFHGERFINLEVGAPRSVFATDLDGDSDMDVLSASQSDNKIAWHEDYDGLGHFDLEGQRIISLDALGAQSVFAADLDGDGDDDVLSASRDNDKIAWYENLDGAGTFGSEQIISTTADGAQSVFAADLDGDSDLDVLSASEQDGKFAWYKNIDGAGSFAPQPVIATGAVLAKAVFATDLDGDGDNDVLGASRGDGTIAWYRNDSNDCSNNAVLDVCEDDCNGNGEADLCDLLRGTSIDCNGNDVPDECETQCPGACDADGDGCLDDLDADPADPYHCGDSDRDSCDDCASGAFDPAGDGLDTDADGSCDAGDCDAVDASVWHEPDSIRTLTVTRQQATSILIWLPPSKPGAASIAYDVLRSPDASDFVGAASCLEADETDRSAVDSDAPSPGGVFHYLVRVENGCPGSSGALGSDSAGVPRTGTSCP